MSQSGACRLVQRKWRGAALTGDTPFRTTPPEKTHQRARIQAAAPGAPLTSPNSNGKAETLHGRGLQGAFRSSLPASTNRKTDDSALPETIVMAESGYLNAAEG